MARRLKHAALTAAFLGTIGLIGVLRAPVDRSSLRPAEARPVAAMSPPVVEIPPLHRIQRVPSLARWRPIAAPGHSSSQSPQGGAAGSPSAATGPNGTLNPLRNAPVIPPPINPPTIEKGGDPVPPVVVCRLDPGGHPSAADVIQACIDRARPYSTLEIPPGIYTLSHQLVVSRPLTIRTQDAAGGSITCVRGASDCAVLAAASDFRDNWGIVAVRSTSDVTLEHLVIDGDRVSRLASGSARLCAAGQNTFGFNASVLYCAGCTLNDVVSKNALCGSGMVWVGSDATIRVSAFVANGDAAVYAMWADGLTLINAPRSRVENNQFIDNSDVGLILGDGVSSRIEGNVVQQREQPSFAGLMLHNFYSDDLSKGGDFREAVITGNTIDCGSWMCVFGIQVGPRPWAPTRIIVGGTVRGNVVRGAKVGINVDGAGLPAAPVAIYANTVADIPNRAYFSDCAKPIPADWMNVSPTSTVDRRNEHQPIGAYLSDSCQLSSALSPDD